MQVTAYFGRKKSYFSAETESDAHDIIRRIVRDGFFRDEGKVRAYIPGSRIDKVTICLTPTRGGRA